MGFKQSYRCKSCGLGATVTGGDTIGFTTRTQTRYCAKCEALVDVLTESWSLPGMLPEEKFNEKLKEELKEILKKISGTEIKYGQCNHCHTLAETVWCADDPCPRCGGAIEATGEDFVLWD